MAIAESNLIVYVLFTAKSHRVATLSSVETAGGVLFIHSQNVYFRFKISFHS